ncbi:hypothetical protein F383_03979 [Gossypium arboreum]|uniref:protein-serine/threonine phosphatase n=1 Tax=Gossypium arboreum TaxID=29729 RepID=A0A0B0P6M4_GOSAR|nr:hypothetical protein F383_03979 [Gossypium arboreum]
MGVYLSTPKTEKFSEDGENDRLRFGLSSMQGWRATMEDAHAAYPDLDSMTSFFGVYDGHGGQAVSKFCAKYLHQQVLQHEAYSAGDIGTSLQKSFLRMDEMMRGQRGWRELAVLGDKIDQVSGLIEGLIWSPRSGEANNHFDDWSSEEAYNLSKDHKPELELEKDRILKAGGFIQVGRINGSLNLARAIGDVEFKQNKTLPAEKQIVTANPDINAVELCDDDEFLVLACDGIWDCMSSQQLVDYVREQLSSETKLSAICERVFDKCLAPTAGGEGCDNMTMILVQFKRPVGSGTLEEQQEQQLLTDQTATTDKSASGSGSGPESESGS